MVRKTGVILKKIWEDEQFFEINFEVRSPFCDSNMNFYTTNAELGELRQGLLFNGNVTIAACNHITSWGALVGRCYNGGSTFLINHLP